jgi:polyhydroxyalkanoate synthase
MPTRIDLPLGHIGMVVSGRARDLCWNPLVEWLAALPSRRSRVAAA